LWNSNIGTDKVIEDGRPDNVIVDERNAGKMIISISIPGHYQVKDRDDKKHQDLALELNHL